MGGGGCDAVPGLADLEPNVAGEPASSLRVIWMLVPVAAGAVAKVFIDGAKRPAARAAVACVLLLAAGGGAMALGWSTIQERYLDYVACQQRAYGGLIRLPGDALVIPGPGTPVAYYLDRLGEKTTTSSPAAGPGRTRTRSRQKTEDQVVTHLRAYIAEKMAKGQRPRLCLPRRRRLEAVRPQERRMG